MLKYRTCWCIADRGEYWAAIEVPENPFKVVDTRTVLLGRGDYINQANAVTATSYALMLHLDHNEWIESEPIMKWLHKQHNDVHAHSSTQDTLLALQVGRTSQHIWLHSIKNRPPAHSLRR